MKAVILAAGKGSRLAPLTDTTPKPLLEIKDGKTILDFILESLPSEIDEVLLIVGYLEEKMKEFAERVFGNFDFKITVVRHELEPGTFSTLMNVKDYFAEGEKFLVLHGDEIHRKDELESFLNFDWAMSVSKRKMPRDYFTFKVDGDGFLDEVVRQGDDDLKNGCLIASGMYVLDGSIFGMEPHVIAGGETSLPGVLFRENKNRKLKIYEERGWMTVNTLEDLEEARGKFKGDEK